MFSGAVDEMPNPDGPQTLLTAFPWGEEPGLSRALADPVIWPRVIPEAGAREALKQAAKRGRVVRPGQVIRKDDVAEMSRLIITLLSSNSGREAIRKEFARRFRDPDPIPVFARRLLHVLGAWSWKEWADGSGAQIQSIYPQEIFPPAAVVLDGNGVEARFRSDAFLDWLSAQSFPDDTCVPIAAFICAHAMRRRDQAREIATLLSEHRPVFLPFLLPWPGAEDPTSVETKNSSGPKSGSETNDEPGTGVAVAEAKQDAPGTISEVHNRHKNDLISSLELLDSDPPVDRFRTALTRAARELEKHVDRLREVDARVERIDRLKAAALRLEFVDPSVSSRSGIVDVSGMPLSIALARAADLQRELESLLQAHLQLSTLRDRLGPDKEPEVLISGRDLAAVTTSLEQRVADLTARLQALREAELVVEEFLGDFRTADERGRLRLIRAADSALWDTLLSFAVERKARGLDGRLHLAPESLPALIAAMLPRFWISRPDRACSLAAAAIQSASNNDEKIKTLSFLSFHQIHELGTNNPSVAPFLSELLLAAAVFGDHPEHVEYLEPLLDCRSLDPAVVRFYQKVLDQWRREGEINLWDPPTNGSREANEDTSLAPNQVRRRLLDIIDHSPGMSGTYHRLRSIARIQFLLPLRDHINRDSPEGALSQWKATGGLDDMVTSVIRSFESIKAPRKVDTSHALQTRRYLESFDRMLRNWVKASERDNRNEIRTDGGSTNNMEALRRAAVEGSVQCASLLSILSALHDGTPSIQLPAADFGARCFADDESLSVDVDVVIRATMVHSWSFAVRHGVAPLDAVVTDYLECALGMAPRSTGDAVGVFLRMQEYEGARAAAEGDPTLVSRVETELETRRAAFREENTPLLTQAEEFRVHDEYIDLCLGEINASLASDHFGAAKRLATELEDLVRRCRGRRDPVRRSLTAQLEEAGISVDDETNVEQLEEKLNRLRFENEDRRRHIRRLQDAAADETIPSPLRDAWRLAAQRLDRPRTWLPPEVARRVADAIDVLHRFIHNRARFREDRDAFDLFVDAFANWVPARLMALESVEPTADGAVEIDSLIQLSEAISGFSPDSHVFMLLGAGDRVDRSAETTLELAAAQRPIERIAVLQSVETESSPDAMVKVASDIREAIRLEPEAHSSSVELRKFCVARDWVRVRIAAANVARAQGDSEGGLLDVETLYAIAVAQTAPAEDIRAFREIIERACLALAASRRAGLENYVIDRNLRLLGPLLLLWGVANEKKISVEQTAIRDGWTVLLNELANRLTDEADERFDWLASVLYKAGRLGSDAIQGSATLAYQIWEVLTGSKDAYLARSDLLLLLARMGRTEALRRLAQSTGPLENLVVQCLGAFDTGRSNPEVRPLALQIATALREQGEATRVPLRPWLLFFDRLGRAAVESGVEGPVELDIEARIADPAGRAVIEARLSPTGHDVPNDLNLEIQIGTGTRTGPVTTKQLLEEEPLLKPRVVSVDVSFMPSGASDPLNCAYRLTGATVRKQAIDVRGRIVIDTSQPPMPSLRRDEIERAWPGAAGDPVNKSQHAFHGRAREIQEIEAAIRASERQRSVMVVGQRRIGKTSLLLEMVRSMPPSPGAPCGAFIDVSGLEIPEHRGSMPVALFQSIVTQLDEGIENKALRQALQGGRRTEVHKLTRGLDPQASFAAAVEGLVDRLNDASAGRTSRLALFIDEFDRFVNPYLTGRRNEVDALMWQLRQIVQRSHRISLVLAGSGLQRLLIEKYQEALYGSIDVVSLEPFGWEKDKVAIQDTFLPQVVRERLCSSQDLASVCRHAAEVCGGHPWYLAVFGRSAAVLANGRRFTVPLLNQVLEVVTRHDSLRSDAAVALKNDPARFYAPIFESLARLDDRGQAIAKIVLAHIAQRVTLEFPWLPLGTALSPPEITGDTDERERLTALQNLEKEQVVVVERKESRMKIRTPLTAAALRDRAVSLIEDALLVLKDHV